MDRRTFFKRMIGGVATVAAVRTWPFRVYSFPSQLFSHSFDVTAAEWKVKEMYSNQQWLAWDEEKQLWYPSGIYPSHHRFMAEYHLFNADHPLIVHAK